MPLSSYRTEIARELYASEELLSTLHDALHAYRYACGQYRDSQAALENRNALERRWQTADAARGVFEDLLAHIAVGAKQ